MPIIILSSILSSQQVIASNQSISIMPVYMNITQQNNSVKIDINNLDENYNYDEKYELWVIDNGFLKKYSGSLHNTLTYYVSNGNYIFKLIRISDNVIMDQRAILIEDEISRDNQILENPSEISEINADSGLIMQNNELIVSACANLIPFIYKKTFIVGESVDINMPLYDSLDVNIDIVYNKEVYRFFGESKKISFIPTREGNYSVLVRCNGEITSQLFFVVADNIINSDIVNQDINNRDGISQSEKINSDSNNNIPALSAYLNYSSESIRVRDSNGRYAVSQLKVDEIIKRNINSTNRDIAKKAILELEPVGIEGRIEFDDLELTNQEVTALDSPVVSNTPDSSTVPSASFSNMPLIIPIESISLKNREKFNEQVRGKKIVDSYAMDLSNTRFSSGRFTKIAYGQELLKCRDWDYALQQCNGEWIKIMDLTPGMPYTLLVSAEDPGYLETGLATINTVKSIYKPGESAEIIIVVLDTNGYLVRNAHVKLSVTAPDSIVYEYSTEDETIKEIDNGIYRAVFYDTLTEGTYEMEVQAVSRTVQYSMASSFKVDSDYEFDIIRNIPHTTDPFKGPFYAEITVQPLINFSPQELYYNFTEKVPANLLIIEAPGAVITYDPITDKQYLTWNNLYGESVLRYTAQPELKTPDLIILGKAVINYVLYGVEYIFEEFRFWFLAIDPEASTEDGLLIYVDRNPDGQLKYRNWTNGLLYGEQDSGINLGNRGSWSKIRCLEEFTQCIVLMSDNGDDLTATVFYSNNWSFNTATQLTGNLDNNGMPFDIECESSNGRCLIAYETNQAATDNIFNYTIWNGSTLGSRQSVTVTGAENFQFTWIKLYPKPNSDSIGIALQNNAGGNAGTPAIYAGIWNGTGFGNWQELTSNSATNGDGYTQHKHFDCAWDGLGRFMCAFGNESDNGILAYRFDGTSWSSLGRIYSDIGGEVWEVSLCGVESSSTFNHTNIGVFASSYNATAPSNKLDGGIWNGTNFSKSSAYSVPYRNNIAETGTNKGGAGNTGQNFKCQWETTGAQALFLWTNNGEDFIRYTTYTVSTKTFGTNNWSVGNQIVADGPSDIRTVDVSANPFTDKVFLVYTDSNRVGGCSVWSGSSWDGTGCNNSAAFETNGARAATSWMSFDWFRYQLQPYITIYRPTNLYTLKDYYGLTNPSSTQIAYYGTFATLPPNSANSPISGTEFPSACYVSTTSSDDNVCNVTSTTANVYAYQSFKFDISDSQLSIDSYKLYHEGRANVLTSLTPTDFNIYVYNWTSDSYIFLRTVYGGGGADSYTETTFDASDDLINNRVVYILLETVSNSGAGGTRRIELITDYISLEVNSLPTWSGNQLINASAIDRDNISSCRWAFYNTTSAVTSQTLMSYSSGFYINTTNTALVNDGLYDVYVFCNDTLNNQRNKTSGVRIDNTLPSITLLGPQDYYNTTLNYVLFSWNVTDLPKENLLCNVTIDGSVSASNVVSAHAANTTKNITSISDGTHVWFVTCIDDAGNVNVSLNRTFDLDVAGPVVTSNYPNTGAFINFIPLDLNFTVADGHNVTNCSVYIDSFLNSTMYNVPRDVITNFTIENISEGLHRWNISCYDTFNFRGNSALRNFTMDRTPPRTYLNTTEGIIFNNTPVKLNYTVIDNLDTNMTCNITVNEIVEDPNIPSLNNTIISRTQDLLDGYKTWYVTCIDDAGNVNISESRTFRVIGGPYVNLISPVNRTINNGYNQTLKYYVQDNDGINSCSLIIDGVLNQTNTTATITNFANNTFFVSDFSEGEHYWNVSCVDTNNMTGNSLTFTISSDRTPPAINLNSPISGQQVTTTPVRFNFTLVDAISINATCNLTIDSNVSTTNKNFVAINGSVTSKTETLVNGLHYWNVTCFDLGGNLNTSQTWNFTVNVTFPLSVSVIADKVTYHEGEIAIINVTIKNESNRLVSANNTIDYIYTNNTYTDVLWWNTSWTKRRPIFINETTNTARSARPVALNFTFSLGAITDCDQLRIINDVDYSEMAYNILARDDVTFCYVVFNGSVSANAVNEQNYHLYYGNPSATSPPAYPDLLGVYTLFDDAFNSLTANWTANTGWDIASGLPLAGNHLHIDGNPVVVDSNITLAASLNLSQYDNVNVSFTWDITNQWDTGPPKDYIVFEFSNDSGNNWNFINEINETYEAVGAVSLVYNLNSSFRVNGFKVRFRSSANADNEEGGIDNFNVSYWYNIQSNVSTRVGSENIFIERILNNTNGTTIFNYDTYNHTYGNYSVVVYATTTNPKNTPGTGYDWFTIIQDVYGPAISLIYPGNGITTHSGNMTFIYNATDLGNNVSNCSLFINGTYNQINTSINETSNNSFTILAMTEGRYNWSVSCYDSLNNPTNSSVYTFYLDDTSPVVTPISPNDVTVATGNVTFTFNATDNFDTLISCNITADAGNYSKLVNAASGNNTQTIISNISEGLHYWNVTCNDNINNTGYSTMLNFTTANIPVVTLGDPFDGYGVNSTNMTFEYLLSSLNVVNCSLILNNAVNITTNASDIPFKSSDGYNSFYLENMSYGIYSWNVLCKDSNGFNGTGTTRTFQLDNAIPVINLFYPQNNQTLYTRNVDFIFNVTDIDDILICNLTIDGLVNKTGVSVNSSKINTTITVNTMPITSHNWSIDCTDNTGFIGYSQLWNFTIESRVSVVLNSPANNTYDNDGNINFIHTPQSVATFTSGFCDLFIDGVFNQKDTTITESAQNTFTVSGLSEGNHSWYVNCSDNIGTTGASGLFYVLVDKTSPSVTSYYPDGDSFNTSSVFFNWTATDNYDASLICRVYVNGTLKTPTANCQNNSLCNSTYTGFTDGLLYWNVTCSDDSLNNGTSLTRSFNVQESPRIVLGNPSNGTRTRVQNQTLYFTATDNSGNISNCSLIFNDAINQTKSGVISGQQNSFNVTNIPDGVHTWTVNCTDPSGNVGTNLTSKYLIIDLTPPNITLVKPLNGDFPGGNNITFNWTATDYPATNINCSLFLDGSYNKSVVSVSGNYFATSIADITDGPHSWYVNCSDNLNNSNISDTWIFTLNQPDIYIDSTRILFNNTNPNENQTVNITANLSNIGGVPVTNALVEFWDGQPGTGVFIGNATGNIGFNSSRIFSVLWNITFGYHTIYVISDPYNVIGELDETNNNATKNISILRSIINSPGNNSGYVNPDVTINFTLQDFTTGLINYSVFIDNVFNGQNGTVTDNISEIINVTFSQGTHHIKIEAQDSQNSIERKKNSTSVYVIIDYTAPLPVINTQNHTWFNYTTPNINITATDNRVTNINYTLYVNGSQDIIGNITNATSLIVALSSLSQGQYEIVMEAFDDFGNIRNSTPKIIYVDTSNPNITLNSPDEGANFTTRTVVLNYSVDDNLASYLLCNVTLDGNIVAGHNNTVGSSRTYTANNLVEGVHYWNVTCRDQALNSNISETRSFNVFVAPSLLIVSPQNNYWSSNADNIFYFNVSDESGLENCSLLFSGIVVQTINNSQIINNATNNFTVTSMQSQAYNWSIECYDNSTYHSYNQSASRILYVDTILPEPFIETSNNSWFKVSNPQIFFNITDNMDSPINYTIYVNGTYNVNGSISNGTSTSKNLIGLQNGTYEIIIEALDEAGNKKNSSSIIINVDSVVPNIVLNYPDDAINITVDYLDLNFTPSDNMAPYLICNLTLDGNLDAINLNVTNGQLQNVSITNLQGGNHYWNVTCIDTAGNRNISETRSFFVVIPDLYVNSSLISFNNSSPKENETINITASIQNIGDNDAYNFVAEIRLNSQAGLLLSNFTLNLSSGSIVNISAIYNLPIGDSTIYVLADVPLSTNGTIQETNESNNVASKTITVSSWHYVLGYEQATLKMYGPLQKAVYAWNLSNTTGGLIFATDVDSTINWINITAISRNRNNVYVSNDFNDIDSALAIQNNSDSVNKTYSASNNPKLTQNMSVFNKQILNVPIMNSTNNSNFITGIMWDSGDGGIEYNGTQDLIFVAPVNMNTLGYNDTYDFEMRVPAKLRQYKSGVDAVALYVELN